MPDGYSRDDQSDLKLHAFPDALSAARKLEAYAQEYLNGPGDLSSLVGFQKELHDIEGNGADFANKVFKQLQLDRKAPNRLLPDIEVVYGKQPGEVKIDATGDKDAHGTVREIHASADQVVVLADGVTRPGTLLIKDQQIKSRVDSDTVSINTHYYPSDQESKRSEPVAESRSNY